MEACSPTMKPKVLSIQSNGGLSERDNGFWGDSVKRRSKNNLLGAQIWKKSLSEKRVRKFKPGVAFSVLTRDINKELAVSCNLEQGSVFIFVECSCWYCSCEVCFWMLISGIGIIIIFGRESKGRSQDCGLHNSWRRCRDSPLSSYQQKSKTSCKNRFLLYKLLICWCTRY